MSEYADALPLLNAALVDLKKGQLVYDERYAMMDLMAAIEINDARTDTYLHAKRQQESQEPPLPPFDPCQSLDAEEIVWVSDEILRLEATFLSGHPLASTLWTCNYLRPSSLTSLCGTDSSTPSFTPSPLTTVFRALLLATLKSCEIVYEEMSKGRVYEHEDVHLPLSSLSFNSLMASCFPPVPTPPPSSRSPLALPGQSVDNPLAQPPPAERTVSVDDVLKALDEALQWLNEQREGAEEKEGQGEMTEQAREALITRVTMRIDLLYVLALLTAPSYSSPSQITHHLTRLASYPSLFPSATASSPSSPPSTSSFIPSPALLSTFHPSSSVPLLGTQQPPRPVTPLSVGEAYDLFLRETVDDLQDLMELWQGWMERKAEGEGWKGVRKYARMAGRKGGSPYIRSVRQSVIATPSNLFSTSPPLHLSLTFLFTLTSLSPLLLQRLSHLRPTSAPAHAVLSWAERLASQFLVPTTSALAGQNRGRQRRIVVKSVAAFAELVREAEEEVVPLLDMDGGLAQSVGAQEDDLRAIRRIPLAMAAHAIDVVLEALLSGFEAEVGLLREEEEARREGWWIGERVAGELVKLWDVLLSATDVAKSWEGREYVEEKRAEAKVIEQMCRGSLKISVLSQTAPPAKFSLPFLSDLAFPSSATTRGRFNQRFDWLSRLCTPSTAALVTFVTLVTWTAYQADLAQVGEDKSSLISDAKTAFTQAVEELGKLERQPCLPVPPQRQRESFVDMRETAQANLAYLDSFDGEKSNSKPAQLRWHSGWFARWA
ncbi:hypothetical protein JCM11251_001646 [Rhodosporidiobolus azoricus]